MSSSSPSRPDGRIGELMFWALVGLSLLLYLAGGRSRAVGGWVLRRATNAAAFWQTVLEAVLG